MAEFQKKTSIVLEAPGNDQTRLDFFSGQDKLSQAIDSAAAIGIPGGVSWNPFSIDSDPSSQVQSITDTSISLMNVVSGDDHFKTPSKEILELSKILSSSEIALGIARTLAAVSQPSLQASDWVRIADGIKETFMYQDGGDTLSLIDSPVDIAAPSENIHATIMSLAGGVETAHAAAAAAALSEAKEREREIKALVWELMAAADAAREEMEQITVTADERCTILEASLIRRRDAEAGESAAPCSRCYSRPTGRADVQ